MAMPVCGGGYLYFGHFAWLTPWYWQAKNSARRRASRYANGRGSSLGLIRFQQ